MAKQWLVGSKKHTFESFDKCPMDRIQKKEATDSVRFDRGCCGTEIRRPPGKIISVAVVVGRQLATNAIIHYSTM
jgi:hypothetical protein